MMLAIPALANAYRMGWAEDKYSENLELLEEEVFERLKKEEREAVFQYYKAELSKLVREYEKDSKKESEEELKKVLEKIKKRPAKKESFKKFEVRPVNFEEKLKDKLAKKINWALFKLEIKFRRLYYLKFPNWAIYEYYLFKRIFKDAFDSLGRVLKKVFDFAFFAIGKISSFIRGLLLVISKETRKGFSRLGFFKKNGDKGEKGEEK